LSIIPGICLYTGKMGVREGERVDRYEVER
jgi:hypothetical protein